MLLVDCAVCSKDVIICDVCKRAVFMDLLHVEREFVRMHLLRRTFCVHVCSERCMRRFDEYLSAEAVSGRLSVKQSFG